MFPRNPPKAESLTRDIGFLVFDGFQLLDAAGPISAFEIGGRHAPGAYRLDVLATRSGAVPSSAGVSIEAKALASAPALDTLVVAGGEGTYEPIHDAAILDFVRAAAKTSLLPGNSGIRPRAASAGHSTPFIRANPRSISAFRSSMSSRPTLNRIVGPPGVQRVAVRCASNGTARTLVAAPGIAEAEQLEPVQERRNRRLGRGPEDHAEEAGRAGEIALPQRVARMIGQGGVDDGEDLRPPRQPAGQRKRLPLGFAQPQLHAAHPAQRQKDIFRAGGDRHQVGRLVELFEPRLVGRHETEQEVGMAGQVFRARLDRHVDAVRMRSEEERRRPGVVHQNAGAVRVRDRGDRGNVLDLEGLRPRRFGQHRSGVRPHQRFDPGADLGVVIGGLDPHPLQSRIGEGAGRTIGRVGHEEMIAGGKRRHHRHDDRCEARRNEDGPGGAGNVGPGRAQSLGRRSAVRAVGIALVSALQRGDVRIEDRRTTKRRQIDEPLRLLAVPPEQHQPRTALQGRAGFVGQLRHGPGFVVGLETRASSTVPRFADSRLTPGPRRDNVRASCAP